MMTLMISCSKKESKNEEMNKKEITQKLIDINTWFVDNKKKWQLEQSVDDGKINWGERILNLIKESNFFSKRFIDNLKQETNDNKHFGLYFYSYQDLGKMLKALCQDNENDIYKGIEKISDDKYRYMTYFSVVLNSLPDPNYDEKYLWLWETYEDGSRWYFSTILIKENDKWVIDKIERHKTVLDK